MDPKKLEAALKVMVLDASIRAFLIENDPRALEQALDALDAPTPPSEPVLALMRAKHGTRVVDRNYGLEGRAESLAARTRAEWLAKDAR